MPYTLEKGKDIIIFATKEDHETPSTVKLKPAKYPEGPIKADGSINWACRCIGNLAVGPCGIEYRDFRSCLHYSEAKPKGSNCMDHVINMYQCTSKYPTLFGTGPNEAQIVEKIKQTEELLEKMKAGISSTSTTDTSTAQATDASSISNKS